MLTPRCLFVAAALAASFVAPSAVRAQGGPAETSMSRDEEIATIRGLISEERARLDDLVRRLDALDGSSASAAPVPAAATAAQAPATTPEAPPRFDFYGDTTLRYVTTTQDYDGCETCPSRFRGRMRLRFGVEGRLAPGLRVVSGITVGEINDPNSTYQSFGAKMSRKVTTYDRAYLVYRPTQASWLDITAGKMPYPWTRSSMTFDVDLYPEGASERASFDFKPERGLENVSVQALQLVTYELPTTKDSTIMGGQATARFRLSTHITTRPVVTFMDIRQPDAMLRGQLSGADVGTKNTNAVVIRDGVAFYASRFRYVNGILENSIATKSPAWPLALAFEYQKNISAASSLDTATSIRFDAGRQSKAGDWFLSGHVFRVEQDAIVSSLGESDWRAPSNVLQQRFQVVRTLHPSVFASWTLYRGRTLDSSLPGALLAPGLPPGHRDPWVNQMYFDIIYRY